MSGLDEALERLHRTGPEFAGGLSNHGPMAVEVLARRGYDDAIGPWLDRYLTHLDPAPAPGRPLAADEQAAALGRSRRYADWEATFTAELAVAPWPGVMAAWAPRLIDGLAGAATHGIIRTAHAVIALEAAGDVPPAPRLAELARGLAYWAATHHVLFPDPPAPTGTLDAAAALAAVPVVPAAERTGFLITARFARATAQPGMAEALAALRSPGSDVDGLAHELASAMATATALHATSAPIAFLHGVTGLTAGLRLAPHLDAADREQVVVRAWHTIAALVAGYADTPLPPAAGTTPAAADPAGVLATAVDGGDEHAIKYADACWWLAERGAPGLDASPVVRALSG